MWKQILELAKRLFMLAEDTKRNRDEIRELREEVRRLTGAVERLAYEIHRVSDKEGHEREQLALRLENELLKFERRLPPAK
jgi:predicted  nucleic acid-binding Zn-ribbon protein